MTAGRPLYIYALELHATAHCNLTCTGCSQGSPKLRHGLEDVDVLERSLRNLRRIVACSKLQVLGGEPLLHPGLTDLLEIAARSGLAQRLCLKTNGLLLGRMPDPFWRLLDEVIVSVYPATRAALERARPKLEIRASLHQVALSYRYSAAFHYITKDARTASDLLVRRIFARCEYKEFTHSLRDGRLYRCAPSVNMAEAQSFNMEGGVDVIDEGDLEHRVKQFLTATTPLDACHYCLGSSGGSFPHSLQSKSVMAAS